MDRPVPPTCPATERESLESWLEFHRATLLMKAEGLSDEQMATASVEPSGLSIAGLLRHLVGVEDWFHAFDQQPPMEPFGDEDYFAADAATVARDVAAWHEAVGRSRRAVEDLSLDAVIERPHWVADDAPKEVRPTSLRWVYAHMIEEYARHNGHADLIRERIDGAVGD